MHLPYLLWLRTASSQPLDERGVLGGLGVADLLLVGDAGVEEREATLALALLDEELAVGPAGAGSFALVAKLVVDREGLDIAGISLGGLLKSRERICQIAENCAFKGSISKIPREYQGYFAVAAGLDGITEQVEGCAYVVQCDYFTRSKPPASMSIAPSRTRASSSRPAWSVAA